MKKKSGQNQSKPRQVKKTTMGLQKPAGTLALGEIAKESPQTPLQRLLEIQPDILAIGPDKSLGEILSTVAETANSLLGGNFCIVFPYDQSSDLFLTHEVTTGGIPEAKKFIWGEPRPKGASRTILQDGEMFIEDYGDPNYIKKYPFLKERVSGGKRLGAYQDVATVKATLGVRLQAGKEHFGVLVVNYPEHHKFQQSEIEIAKIYASQAAIAIRNAKLYGRYRALIDSAESFTALSTTQDPKETLKKIILVVHGILNSDMTVLFPYDRKNDLFVMDRLVAIGKNIEDYKFAIPRAEGGTRKVLREKEIIHYNLDDAPLEWKERLGSGPFVKDLGIQAVAAVHLKVADESLGVLYINYKYRHIFDQAEIDLINAFANQVALILFNSNVFEREQKARNMAETLQAAAEILIQSPTLHEALERTLEQVKKVVHYDAALFMLAEGSRLVSKAVKGFEFPEKVLEFKLSPADDIIFKEYGHITKPIFLSNVQKDLRWQEVPTVDWVRGWLGVRLYSKGGDAIGEIGLYSREENFYKQEDADALQSFSNQAVFAIENARFLEELRIISDIQRQVSEKSADLENVITTILRNALNLVGANIGQVLLLEDDDFHISISASTSPEDVGRLDLTIDNCITGLAIKGRRALLISNIKSNTAYQDLYKPPQGYEANSELVVPLTSEGKIIGALNAESPEISAFSQHHEDLLTTLATVTASAIRTAKSAVRELNVIEQVQEILLRGSFDLKEVFDLMAESARKTTGAETGELWLLRGDDVLENAAIVPEIYAGSAMTSLDVNNSVNGDAILTKTAQLVPDTHQKPNYQLASGVEMRGELAVPLLLGGRAIGTINVESKEPNVFTRHHQVLLQTLAEQAAIAIQSARREQERRTITDIQRELLSAAFDQKRVLNLILTRGLELIKATLGQVLVIEKDRLLIQSSTRGPDVGNYVEINNSVTGVAVKQQNTVLVKNVKSEEPYSKIYQPFLGLDIHSELVVPLFIGNEVIGVLNIEDERIGAFTEYDQRLLESLAQQASLTLRMAEAFGVVERFRDIQDGILSEKYTVEQASDEILRVAQQLIGAETGQILLLEENNPEILIIKASTNPEEVNQTTVKIYNSISGMAVERREPVNVSDVKTEEPYKSRYQQFLGGDMHSELVVPLRVGENIIGVVNVESPRIRAFTQRHIDILSTLAGQAAMAYRIVEEFNLKKRASESDKMLSAGQIVHRLTGRSGAIRGWIEIIKEEQPELMMSNETFAMAINDIELKAGEILKLVDELKQRASEQFKLVDIPHLLQVALQKLSATEEFSKFGDRIVLEDKTPSILPQTRADSTLAEVFLNLLTNAFKEMPNGGKVEIQVEITPSWINISFKDNGTGIPPEMHEIIFDARFSGSNKPGHGLGLWWSRAYVRTLGGDILLKSERGHGACFTVKLPIAS